VEQARAWSLPAATSPMWSLAVVGEDDADDEAGETLAISTNDVDEALGDYVQVESTIDSTFDGPPPTADRRSIARPLVNRLPPAFRVPALRLLELALREDLGDAVLAAD